MDTLVSPKYQMQLVKDVEKALWAEYATYKNVEAYIKKWQFEYDDFGNANFYIHRNDNKIDLAGTLHDIDGGTLLKIAIDLGVDTPDFIPSIPTFKNKIKSDCSTAYSTFDKAFKQIETHPDIAIGLANSALESIIKEILKDKRINSKINGNKTLYDLTAEILKVFQLFPNSDMPIEIKTIGGSLLSINQGIEKLRSEKTNVHGKTAEDYVIHDPIYTYFIFNCVTTVGLFLHSYYKTKFPKTENRCVDDVDDLPF